MRRVSATAPSISAAVEATASGRSSPLSSRPTGHNVSVNWDTTKPTGEARKVADITKARELLGYDPKVGLPEAIALTVDWFRNNRQAGRR